MSDPVLVALITGGPPFLLALGTLVTVILNSRKTAEIKADTAKVKEETGKIHIAVNSNLDKVKSELVEARQELSDLHTLIARMVKDRPDVPPEDPVVSARKTVDSAIGTLGTLESKQGG